MNTFTNKQASAVRQAPAQPTITRRRFTATLGFASRQLFRQGARLAAVVPLVYACVFAGQAQAQSAACYINWALAWDQKGDYDRAIADYNQALAICPDDAHAHINRGYDWFQKGDFDKAIADDNQALAICPTDGLAYCNRGAAWYKKGDFDRAVADYNQSLAVDPNLADAYNNLGVVEASRGQYEKAKADYYRSLSVDPNYATAYENLGFFLATCPDPKYRNGKKAFENASQGFQIANGDDAYFTANSLAAAYAECGDFAQARTWQEKVIKLAPADDKPMQTSRLELYQQNKPYRSLLKPE